MCKKLRELIFNIQSSIKYMKAMSKSELADAAGVSVKVLMNWCKPFRSELEAMGLKAKDRVLTPGMVKFIADRLCIDVDND